MQVPVFQPAALQGVLWSPVCEQGGHQGAAVLQASGGAGSEALLPKEGGALCKLGGVPCSINESYLYHMK